MKNRRKDTSRPSARVAAVKESAEATIEAFVHIFSGLRELEEICGSNAKAAKQIKEVRANAEKAANSLRDAVRNLWRLPNSVQSIEKTVDDQQRKFATTKQVLIERTEKAIALSRTDPLTGLLNRRAFVDDFVAFFTSPKRRSSERGIPITFLLILMDLRDFSSINDTPGLGHDVGDKVLRKVGDLISEHIRSVHEMDLRVRWGGDEFVVVMQDPPDIEQARQIMERFAQVVRTYNWSMEADLARYDCKVDVDFGGLLLRKGRGCSSNPKKIAEILEKQMIKGADRLMYKAKRNHPEGAMVFGEGIIENDALQLL